MSHDPNDIDDKLELHHRQQLSALVDGELAPDEARFLLRRLEHDGDLCGRFERWHLCGDVLRGQVRRAAAPDLGARIAAGVAAGAAVAAPVSVPPAQAGGRRQAWTRWGGGAALAASVAAVALFVGRPAAIDPASAPAPMAAVQALPATEAVLAAVPGDPAVTPAPMEALSAPAPASVRRDSSRALASTRSLPVPATVVAQADLADAVADAGSQLPDIGLPPADPFASPEPLQARPWPRAVLAQPAGNAYTAGFGAPSAPASFYPFEPRLPVQADPSAGAEADDRPAPQPVEGRQR